MLISEDYREQNRLLHENNAGYGIKGEKRAEEVSRLIEYRKGLGGVEPVTVLDYGCGKQTLHKAIHRDMNGTLTNVTWQDYDPCVEGLDSEPMPADIVICTDVLEHIEPECIDEVLADIKRLTQHSFLATICTEAALKTLPDGRNTHVLIQPEEWWRPKLSSLFPDFSTNYEPTSGPKTFIFTATRISQ